MRDDPVESLAPIPVTEVIAPGHRPWRARIFAPITAERCQQTQHELAMAAALSLDYVHLLFLSYIITTVSL